ncbi:hypothetical protein ES708_09433 [subsurface metagenome]
MNLRFLQNLIRNILARLKNDAQDLVRKSDISKGIAKKERKPINVWVAVFVSIVSFLAFYLVLPMFAGIISIVFKEVKPDSVPSISHEALIGLIIVSTALGAFILWFAAHPTEDGEKKKADVGMIKYIGKLFFFAALSFSLFMLLSPLLPSIKSSTAFYDNALKYVTVISFIGGSFSFAIADVLGLVYLWKF